MFTTLIVWMDYRFGGTKHTSEQARQPALHAVPLLLLLCMLCTGASCIHAMNHPHGHMHDAPCAVHN